MLALMLMMAAEAAQPAYRPRPISAADQAEIKRQADAILMDGPSTRWQWPARRSRDLYCTMFNSKNGFGAYTGWRPAMFLSGKLSFPEGEVMLRVYQQACGTAGYIPPATQQP